MSFYQPEGTPTAATGDPGCAELLARLAAEETALEFLLFKLREQHLVLSSGEQRWLAPCTSEVDAAVKQLVVAGQAREAAARAVHGRYGLPAGSKINDLANVVSDELTCQQLLQRQRHLRDVLDQVRRCSRQNREMLAHGLAATNDALALLGAVPTYDSAGSIDRTNRTYRSFDARV